MPGICKSNSTTSGRNLLKAFNASAPLAASPASSSPGSRANIAATPSRRTT